MRCARFGFCWLAVSGLLLSWPGTGVTADALRRPSKISLDPAGALVVDGARVFPITLTIVPSPQAKAPNGKLAYAEFRDGGVHFMRSGGPRWDQKTIEAELQMQSVAAECGLRCSPWLGWELANIKPGDLAREEQLRKIVGQLRTSPGMGLWKGADEPDWGKKDPAHVAHTAKIIHELDPEHPIWLVQAPRGTVESLKRYDAGWDIGGIDIYPVSYPPGRHSEAANKELSMVGDFTRMMRAAAGPKPFWMTLQIAFSGTTPPKGIIRFPTFSEERFMAYEAIINGSRGLTFFGGGLLPTLNERDRALGWNWTFWDRALKPLLREFRADSPLHEALVAPDSTLPMSAESKTGAGAGSGSATNTCPVEFLVRRVDSRVYLLACKKEGPAVHVQFSGLPAGCGIGQVLFEEPRTVETRKGAFTDWFAAFDVHVYRFVAAPEK